LLAGADVRLDPDTLDAVDALVPPGTTLNPADRGWTPPWIAARARRRLPLIRLNIEPGSG
jgi:hypothetical protein